MQTDIPRGFDPLVLGGNCRKLAKQLKQGGVDKGKSPGNATLCELKEETEDRLPYDIEPLK